MKIATIVVV